MRLRLLGLSDCAGPSSVLNGPTIFRIVGFAAVRLCFVPSAGLVVSLGATAEA